MGHGPNKRRYIEKIDQIVASAEAKAQGEAARAKIPLVCEAPGCEAMPVFSDHKGERLVFWCSKHLPPA